MEIQFLSRKYLRIENVSQHHALALLYLTHSLFSLSHRLFLYISSLLTLSQHFHTHTHIHAHSSFLTLSRVSQAVFSLALSHTHIHSQTYTPSFFFYLECLCADLFKFGNCSNDSRLFLSFSWTNARPHMTLNPYSRALATKIAFACQKHFSSFRANSYELFFDNVRKKWDQVSFHLGRGTAIISCFVINLLTWWNTN